MTDTPTTDVPTITAREREAMDEWFRDNGITSLKSLMATFTDRSDNIFAALHRALTIAVEENADLIAREARNNALWVHAREIADALLDNSAVQAVFDV
jgi:hypothetical protein